MEALIPLLEKVDIISLLALGALLWMFYNRLNAKIDKVDLRLTTKIDRLSDKVEDIDRRLCRIEGALSAKDCCVLQVSEKTKKTTG